MEYLTVENFEKGVVFGLLSRSFEPVMDDELEAKLKKYDEEIFSNPETVGVCVFLTQHDDTFIGMASWDPRNFPKAIVGYNCIIPGFRGVGFGKLQFCELMNRLIAAGFTEVSATTGDHPFYVPSQKMYESYGFKEIYRQPTSSDSRYGAIDYHLIL